MSRRSTTRRRTLTLCFKGDQRSGMALWVGWIVMACQGWAGQHAGDLIVQIMAVIGATSSTGARLLPSKLVDVHT